MVNNNNHRSSSPLYHLDQLFANSATADEQPAKIDNNDLSTFQNSDHFNTSGLEDALSDPNAIVPAVSTPRPFKRRLNGRIRDPPVRTREDRSQSPTKWGAHFAADFPANGDQRVVQAQDSPLSLSNIDDRHHNQTTRETLLQRWILDVNQRDRQDFQDFQEFSNSPSPESVRQSLQDHIEGFDIQAEDLIKYRSMVKGLYHYMISRTDSANTKWNQSFTIHQKANLLLVGRQVDDVDLREMLIFLTHILTCKKISTIV